MANEKKPVQKPVIQLSGGNLVKFDPSRPKLHPNAENPWVRFDPTGSGSLLLSMGTYTLFRHISTKGGGDPEPTHVEFVIRSTPGGVYLILALTKANKPEAREFKFQAEYRVIREINPQMLEASLQFDAWTLYTMEIFEAEDADYGRVLAAHWSTAVASARPEKTEGQEAKKDETKAAEAKANESKAKTAAAKDAPTTATPAAGEQAAAPANPPKTDGAPT